MKKIVFTTILILFAFGITQAQNQRNSIQKIDGPEIKMGLNAAESITAYKVIGKMEKNGSTILQISDIALKGNIRLRRDKIKKGMKYKITSKEYGTYEYLVSVTGKKMVKHNSKIIMNDGEPAPESYSNDPLLQLAMNAPAIVDVVYQGKKSHYISFERVNRIKMRPNVVSGQSMEPVQNDSQNNKVPGNVKENGKTPNVSPGATMGNQEKDIENSGVLIGGMNNSGPNTNRVPSNIVRTQFNKVTISEDVMNPNIISSWSHGNGKNKINFSIVKNDISKKLLDTRLLENKSEETSDVCISDLFRTSGATNIWKVFNEGGYSNVTNVMPGAIYDLSELNGQFFKVVEEYERNPIQIQLDDVNQSSVQSVIVDNPQYLGDIRTAALIPILTNMSNQNLAADLDITTDYERIFDSKQLNMSLGGTIPYAGSKITMDAYYNEESESESFTYNLELYEPYYTLTVEGASQAHGNFFVDESLNSQKKFGYIKSVTFGRRVIATFYSSKAVDKLDTGLTFDATTPFGDYDASFGLVEESQNDQIKYSLQVKGGSTNNDVSLKEGTLETMLEDLENIANNGNENTHDAVPLHFDVQTFDGDLIGSDYGPMDILEESCNPTFKLSLMGIHGVEVNEGNVADKEIELYGSWRIKKYNSNDVCTLNESYSFASSNNPIKFHENTKKNKRKEEFSDSEAEAGNVPITIFHEDLTDGYIIISIDAYDKDTTSNDDLIAGSSGKIYIRDFDTHPVIIQPAKGDSNDIDFHFRLMQE